MGAPFVTGGANLPLASRGSGSLVTGFGPGSGMSADGAENLTGCDDFEKLFWFCRRLDVEKGDTGGGPVRGRSNELSGGEGSSRPKSAPAAE